MNDHPHNHSAAGAAPDDGSDGLVPAAGAAITCDAALDGLDELLDGAAISPSLEAHLAGCAACQPAVDARLRQHRLLLEMGAEARFPGQREALLARLGRRSLQGNRRWQSRWVLPLAAAAGLVCVWGLIMRPSASPTQAGTATVDAAGIEHPWPWAALRRTPGSSLRTSVDGDQHTIQVLHGRISVDSHAREQGMHLAIALGAVQATLVGTQVDVHRLDTQAVIRVLAGRVILHADGQEDVSVGTGEEAHVSGSIILPPMPSLPGTAWAIQHTMPQVEAMPILVPAARCALADTAIQVVDDARAPGGAALTSQRGHADTRMPDDADVVVQASTQVELGGAPAWTMQLYAAHAQAGAFGCLVWPVSGARVAQGQAKMDAPPTGGMYRWMPTGDAGLVLIPQGAAPCQLGAMFYRPGGRIAAILLRPMLR